METRQQVPSCPGGTLYTIRAGDTFFSLAARFNTSVDAIIEANPNVNPDALAIGQQICIPVPPIPGPCPGGTIYTIRAGDTLFALANRFNTTVNAILDANPGLDPENLQVGRRICIPVPPVPGPCPGGTIYTIRAGDTLFALANRFNTTVNAILDANPGLDPENLQVGRRICIPVPPSPPTCPGSTYTIRAGDTLFGIAQRLGFTLQALLASNPGIDPNRLRVGQVICLPPAPNGPVPCPGGSIYVVRAGDTMVGIANRFGLTLRQLLAANPQISDPDVITIGQRICIPGGARSCAGENYAGNISYPPMMCPFAPYCFMFFRPF
jgi:peptidoglycan endopeptidase LytF